MHSKVRMIVGSVNQATSSTCMVSCLADLYILYAPSCPYILCTTSWSVTYVQHPAIPGCCQFSPDPLW